MANQLNHWESHEEEFQYYVEVHTWATVLNNLMNSGSGRKGAETVSEWMTALEGLALGLLAKGEIYKFLTTVMGMTAEEAGETLRTSIRNFNAKKTAEALAIIYKQFKSAGIEPHRVPAKFLFPILDGLSLEEDNHLREKWKNLLASAISTGEIHPSYTSILSQLSSLDAKVLESIDSIEKMSSRHSVDENEIFKKLSKELDTNNQEKILISIRESIENLKRLMLITAREQRHLGLADFRSSDRRSLVSVTEDDSSLGISNLGSRFLKAVN